MNGVTPQYEFGFGLFLLLHAITAHFLPFLGYPTNVTSAYTTFAYSDLTTSYFGISGITQTHLAPDGPASPPSPTVTCTVCNNGTVLGAEVTLAPLFQHSHLPQGSYEVSRKYH
jgi:hypothetical protein